MSEKRLKLCLVSSSGGHFEQLRRLSTLEDDYKLVWITEKTDYSSQSDYYLSQSGLKDYLFPIKYIYNSVLSLVIWFRERPDVVITTGTMVALPLCFIAKLTRKKVIYIETFARVKDGTRSGKLMYRFADLFIYQWESLKYVYPDAVFGGSIY